MSCLEPMTMGTEGFWEALCYFLTAAHHDSSWQFNVALEEMQYNLPTHVWYFYDCLFGGHPNVDSCSYVWSGWWQDVWWWPW